MTYLALKKIFLTLLILLLTSACMQGKQRNEWKPVDPQSAPVVHQVQWSGETLEFIAKWYTGSTTNLEALADANPNINPEALAIGNKIFICFICQDIGQVHPFFNTDIKMRGDLSSNIFTDCSQQSVMDIRPASRVF